EVCKGTRDPPQCEASLSGLPKSAAVPETIDFALSISSRNLAKGRAMVQSILDSSSGDFNRTTAAKNCFEFLHMAEYRINLTGGALPGRRLKDARAWMSAAVVYEYDCWSALKYANTSHLVGQTMEFFNSSVIASGSDVLGMLMNFDVYGEKTGAWAPPKTERAGFWEPDSPGTSWPVRFPTDLTPDATVCKSGCSYASVQQAVDAAPADSPPEKRFVIRILTGVYSETVRVPLEKKNVVFLGDGIGKTVITGSLNVGQRGISTFNSATVGVSGDGFTATGLTIENTAGPDAHQAVAFRSDSDRSILHDCEFIGNQDTLYAHALRQYYDSCKIQGNVDFIFGNSAAVFQDCLILVAPRQLRPEKGETNAVTAHGRVDPGQSTGFVFRNCEINGTDSYMDLYRRKPSVQKNFLGRPWKEYSRAVFIGCRLEAIVHPQGWLPWSGDFALKTLYFGEFQNNGPGSDTAQRVKWSTQIPAQHVSSYSLQNFIQ
ncbi:hypothetical protein M569_06508, partial [Genlisea aurea]